MEDVKKLRQDIAYIIGQLRSAGIFDEDTLNFMQIAADEKIVNDDVGIRVKRKEYIDSLIERADRMSDESFGNFVKKTVWTVDENGKQ